MGLEKLILASLVAPLAVSPATALAEAPPVPRFDLATATDSVTGFRGITVDAHSGPSLLDGPHTFAVQAIDSASNADPTPASRDFVLDTAAPETPITRQPKRRIATRRKSRRVRVFFRSGAGASFECRLDRAAFRRFSSPYGVSAMSRPGGGRQHRISVRATDQAGNVADPAIVVFRVVRKR